MQMRSPTSARSRRLVSPVYAGIAGQVQGGTEMKCLRVTMPDGSKWDVPVHVIARNRATYYAYEFDGDTERSLKEDTLSLFKDDYHIRDWAANNMNWNEVVKHAIRLHITPEPDYQEGWMNGAQEIVDDGKEEP